MLVCRVPLKKEGEDQTLGSQMLPSSFNKLTTLFEDKKVNESVDFGITCSICAIPIPDYAPKFSEGLLYNPACSDCADSDIEIESVDDIVAIRPLNTDLECDLATSLISSKDLLNNTMPIKVTSEVSPTSCTRIDKIYQCPICRKSFGIPLEFNLLELHMKDKHEAELDLKSLEADSVCIK